MRSPGKKTKSDAAAMADRPAAPTTANAPRLAELDLLRGLVMVLMVLDHAWYFFSSAKVFPLAADLSTVSIPMFFTAWLPTFCAPVFLVLAGMGTFFQRAKGGSTAAVQQFLVTRGLWLIVLDVTVVHWLQHFCGGVIFTLVLWGIGWGMIGLAAIMWLPSRWVGIIGVLLLCSQNLLDGYDADVLNAGDSWFRSGWVFLRHPGWWNLQTKQFYLTTSVAPYLGFIAVGFAAGELYQQSRESRRRWLLAFGCGCFLLFAALRLAGGYGDPHPWQPTDFKLRCLTFLNVSALPPSFQFGLLSLGGLALILAALESRSESLEKWWLTTLGRVPLFFYLLQWLLLHLLAIALALALGRPYGWLFAVMDIELFRPQGWTEAAGYSLPVVYLMWLLTVGLAYPLCVWFAEVKRKHKWWWLRYL